jgi:hypothetical protein
MIRETFSMAKTYAGAREHPGQSELLDEIVSTRPRVPTAHDETPDEFGVGVLSHLNQAASLLRVRATEAELDEYRHFVISVAESVAQAHREGTSKDPASDAERAAIVAITEALDTPRTSFSSTSRPASGTSSTSPPNAAGSVSLPTGARSPR